MAGQMKSAFMCFLFLVFCHADPEVVFQASPTKIISSLTNTLTMMCTLNYTSVFGPTNSDPDIRHVTSLVISRSNGTTLNNVASVTQFDAALAYVDQSKLQVTGNVSGNTGFISLTWQHPSHDQSGSYVCEINTMNSVGQGVVLTDYLQIDARGPSDSELLNYLVDLQSRVSDLEIKADNSKLEETDLEIKTNATLTSLNRLQAQVNDLEKEKDIAINAREQLSMMINQTEHFESSRLMCRRVYTWTPMPNDTYGVVYTEVSQKFSKAYDRPPIVHASVDQYMYGVNHQHALFAVYVVNVDENGFTLRCQAFNDSNPYGYGVRWLSLPSSP